MGLGESEKIIERINQSKRASIVEVQEAPCTGHVRSLKPHRGLAQRTHRAECHHEQHQQSRPFHLTDRHSLTMTGIAAGKHLVRFGNIAKRWSSLYSTRPPPNDQLRQIQSPSRPSPRCPPAATSQSHAPRETPIICPRE